MNKKKSISIIIIIFCISCSPPKEFLLRKSKQAGIDKRYIRVLIHKSKERIIISSKSRIRVSEMKNRNIKYDGKGRNISFYPEKIKKSILVESWGTPLSFNKKNYRGMIELHNVLGELYVINVLSIAEYLYGVIPSEISSSWKIEAIKAQAVAARTYAYYHFMNKKSIYDLDATTNFQAYNGISVEQEKTNRAIDETSGQIMIYNNKPILAFFHSTCGGKTVDDKYVWNGDDKPYLQGVRCNYCKKSPHYKWEKRISLYETRQSLKKRYKGIGRISGITMRKKNGRVVSAIIRHKNGIVKMTGNNFRLLFPQARIKSLFFTAKKIKSGLIIRGHGWGHGVGMCQWGSKRMAEKGANYKNILKHYYNGIRIIYTNKLRYAGR